MAQMISFTQNLVFVRT